MASSRPGYLLRSRRPLSMRSSDGTGASKSPGRSKFIETTGRLWQAASAMKTGRQKRRIERLVTAQAWTDPRIARACNSSRRHAAPAQLASQHGANYGTFVGTMKLSEDIKPVTQLKTGAAKLLQALKQSRRPVV